MNNTEISEEFIKYGRGDEHSRIVNTCIKEYYVDSGVGLNKYNKAILDIGGNQKGWILKNALVIYAHKISRNISYKII